jgi:RNA recognition motif-containing protein
MSTANLIVNYLPQCVGESDLLALFQQYGSIAHHKVVRDQAGASKGFGFVKFAKQEHAAAAKEALDGMEIMGKRIKVSFAEPQDKKRANLYIGGLPVFYGEDDVKNLLEEGVIEVKIIKDQDGISKGIAFVQISDMEIARKAIEDLHDTVPPKGSSRIVVRFSDKDSRKNKEQQFQMPMMMSYPMFPHPIPQIIPASYGPAKRKGSKTVAAVQPQYAQIPVPYYASPSPSPASIFSFPLPGVSAQLPSVPGSNQVQYSGVCLFVFHVPLDCTEQILYTLFSSYGYVTNVKLPRDPSTGTTKGYAFVNLSSHQEALNAIAGLNGYAIGNKRLKVSFKTDSGQ